MIKINKYKYSLPENKQTYIKQKKSKCRIESVPYQMKSIHVIIIVGVEAIYENYV